MEGFFRLRLVAIFLLTALCLGDAGSGRQSSSQSIELSKLESLLQPGDLIFRSGPEAISQVVIALDGNTQYSHVGLIFKEEGFFHVIHATPAEKEEEIGHVRKESLSDFLHPDRARSFVAYRLIGENAEKLAIEASRIAEQMAEHKIPFDDAYDLNSDDKVYCTEMVWKAYKTAGATLEVIPRKLKFPFFSKEVIFPSTLLESPNLKKVCC